LSAHEAAFNEYVSQQWGVVCKHGPAGTFDFEASATGGNTFPTNFSLEDGACAVIWGALSTEEGPSALTVTEILGDGMQVDSIQIVPETQAGPGARILLTGTNTATATGLDYYNGVRIKFFNSITPPPPPPTGGEGCTPGYWKQRHHFDSWVGYAPSDLFDDVFDDAFPGMTLLQVVSQGGGGLKALGRHTVAALLNASGSVDYAYTTQGVIDAFNAAFASGSYEQQKNLFETQNEMGCPLN